MDKTNMTIITRKMFGKYIGYMIQQNKSNYHVHYPITNNHDAYIHNILARFVLMPLQNKYYGSI